MAGNKTNHPKKNRVGEVNYNHAGLKMTIIEYTNSGKMKVQFDDGAITNTTYDRFRKGMPMHPNTHQNVMVGKSHSKKTAEKYIGQSIRAKNGLMMTVIAYKNNREVTIQFEDGVIVKHQRIENFRVGEIKHPNIKTVDIDTSHIGETKQAFCGLDMTIVGYRGHNDIDIQFEDGYIAEHMKLCAFKLGNIGHPVPYVLNGIEVGKSAYAYQQERNYFCKCTRCGNKDVMSIEEIRNHICPLGEVG